MNTPLKPLADDTAWPRNLWENDIVFDLSSGQIVADKYRIDGVIGAGGMGVVVGATHLELDQRVAIKFLRDASPDALARFQREARLIVRLKSVHVARVFDIGTLDDDTPFIVMEMLEGEDLSKVLEKRGGRLPIELAVDYVLEACEAIAEAHTLGMVHRDLKPANLFLARGPGGSTSVKVLDFGISKSVDERVHEGTSGGLTNEGMVLGSPGYMSPEQMNSSRDVDSRSDIYAIGAILYRLAGGQNPHKGDSLVSVLASMAMQPLTPLKELVPGIPDAFAAAVERCLAQDASARYANVADLARAIAPFGSRRGKASAEQIIATMTGDSSNATTLNHAGRKTGSDANLGSSTTSAAVLVTDLAVSSDAGPTLVSPDGGVAIVPRGSRPGVVSVVDGAGELSLSATEPLGATVVSPLSIPSSPSYPPLPPGFVPSAFDAQRGAPRTQTTTSPDARKRRMSTAMRTNLLALTAGVAVLASAIAWVTFSRAPRAQTTEPLPATTLEAASAPTAPTPSPTAPVLVLTSIPTTPATPAPSALPSGTARPKPRPHPTTHRTSGAADPPSATDVPGGRR